jgi:hypothetical protein
MARSRALVASMLAALYAALSLVYVATDERERALGAALAVASPLALWLAYRGSAQASTGDLRPDAARTGFRGAVLGALLALVGTAAPGRPAFQALLALGAAIAGVAAIVGFSRFPSLGGLAARSGARAGLEAAAVVSLPWTIALGLPLVALAQPERVRALDPRVAPAVASGAALATLGVAYLVARFTRASRGFELGVPDRTRAAEGALVAGLASGVALSASGLALPEQALPLASALGSVVSAYSALARDPSRLLARMQRVLSLVLFVLSLAGVALLVMRRVPSLAEPIVVAVASLGVLGAALVEGLARRFSGPSARLLDATRAVSAAASLPEPDEALGAALFALRTELGREGEGALVLGAPAERLSVDRAGFLHRVEAALPEVVVALANEEPERVLRRAVLEDAEVRRPDVRPARQWLAAQGFEVVLALGAPDAPVGVLGLPLARRLLGLEEARALRGVADRVAALAEASAQLARSRARELDEQRRASSLAGALGAERSARARTERWLRSAVVRAARPATVAVLGAASRGAALELSRLVSTGEPFALVRAPGVDALAWAARAHLEGARRDGPFSVLDGPACAELTLDALLEPSTSVVEGARGGTLVLVDPQRLSRDVQRFLARALPAPGAPDGLSLVVVARSTVDALAGQGSLGHELADRLGDRAVLLPTLAERPEDLRALALAVLVEHGEALGTGPLGIEPAALELLYEEPLRGNELELSALLLAAALALERGARPVLTAAHMRVALRRTEDERSRPRPPARRAR